ncbi:restriction endonuclease subunit S [Candidatus Magnetaquicoccus inordinatus]|uniref:restriction endonuclease subunit S n=1 Tax=Candidatus Magnetaquicoccus inordinatus TaxID=2496818 RepID=UPI00102BC501|nr:restriction endonuclease subunit S [Candidatus Magnetaquicoccus inordinatus]
MNIPRYTEYKDSGVEWLGEVPGHWGVVPLKHLAEFINGNAFKPAEWVEFGIPIIRIQNLNGSGEFNYFDGEVEERYLVHDGELLFGWSGNRGTSFGPFLWQWNEVCALNQHIFRVVPFDSDKKSLYWTLKAVTTHVEDQAHGIIGMVHITKGDLGTINVPVPLQEEQSAIAAFLDRETGKIDALVAEQEKLISLLKEKRQEVISHAVTKGLNPDAPMKDSGIEWLGALPEHWKAGYVRYFARLESGHTPSRQHPEYWENCTIPWFSLADVGQIRNDEVIYVYDTKELVSELGLANSSARLLPKGTVMLSRTASVGYSAIMGCDMATTQDFANWVCGPELISEFLLFVMRGLRNEFNRLMMGSTHQTIYMPDIAKLALGVPPLPEQSAIVAYLDQQTAKLDTLTAEAQRAIELLKERRSALISAAVTGKIDVRGMAT